jgi:hypothetical protein
MMMFGWVVGGSLFVVDWWTWDISGGKRDLSGGARWQPRVGGGRELGMRLGERTVVQVQRQPEAEIKSSALKTFRFSACPSRPTNLIFFYSVVLRSPPSAVNKSVYA